MMLCIFGVAERICEMFTPFVCAMTSEALPEGEDASSVLYM